MKTAISYEEDGRTWVHCISWVMSYYIFKSSCFRHKTKNKTFNLWKKMRDIKNVIIYRVFHLKFPSWCLLCIDVGTMRWWEYFRRLDQSFLRYCPKLWIHMFFGSFDTSNRPSSGIPCIYNNIKHCV